jgi:hypothetical protein
MQAKLTDSPVPGVIPDTAYVHEDVAPLAPTTPGRRGRGSNPLAKLLGVICGDKYMVDAYPVAEPVASPPKER